MMLGLTDCKTRQGGFFFPHIAASLVKWGFEESFSSLQNLQPKLAAFVHAESFIHVINATATLWGRIYQQKHTEKWSRSPNDKRSRSQYNDINSAQERRGRACKPPN